MKILILVLVIIRPTFSQRSASVVTPHGTIYGFTHLDPDSYIYQNRFRSFATGPSSYLTNAIFYGYEIRFGSTMHRPDTHIDWTDEKEREWRATVSGSYFGNKIPQTDDILSAALVDVAALAFGVRSLLPLNVPPKMPLIYCRSGDAALRQSAVELNGIIYDRCKTTAAAAQQLAISCINECDEARLSAANLFLSDGALRSHLHIFCNATRHGVMTVGNVLQCHYGEMSSRTTSFVPSSRSSMHEEEALPSRHITLSARIHKVVLALMGKHELAEARGKEWIPEALIAPSRNTTRRASSRGHLPV